MHLQLIRCIKGRLKGLGVISATLLLAGCASTPVYEPADIEVRDVVPEETLPGSEPPRDYNYDLETGALLVEDLNTSRARYYQEQAQQGTSAADQVNAILSAAEYYIQADDFDSAERVALDLTGQELDTVQDHRLRVINAYVAYASGNYPGTLRQLQPVLNYVPPSPPVEEEDEEDEPSTTPVIPTKPPLSTQQVDALLLSSFAYQQLGDFNSGIHALIEREYSLVGAARVETTRYIWQIINSLSVERRQLILESSPYPLVRNRIEQSLDTQASHSIQAPQQFGQWRQDFNTGQKQSISDNWGRVRQPVSQCCYR